MKAPTVALFALVCWPLVCCSSVFAQSAPAGLVPSGNGTADGVTVSGQTVDIAGQPLRKTTLTMRVAKPDLTGVNPSPYSATSGADGTFEFKVTPGSYIPTAPHAGYLTVRYGGARPSSPGVTLSVVAGGPMTDLRVALTPISKVTGKVLDEDGDPVARLSVQLLRSVYLSGTRRLMPAGSVPSDADGMYKIQNVSLASTISVPAPHRREWVCFWGLALRGIGCGPEGTRAAVCYYVLSECARCGVSCLAGSSPRSGSPGDGPSSSKDSGLPRARQGDGGGSRAFRSRNQRGVDGRCGTRSEYRHRNREPAIDQYFG